MEQLERMLKGVKITTMAVAVVVFLLITISIYDLITKHNNNTLLPLLAVGFCCGAMILINYINVGKLKKEVALRKNK